MLLKHCGIQSVQKALLEWKIHFSVCALGENKLRILLSIWIDWDNRLEELGAKRVFPRKDCDVDFDEPYAEWANGALPAISAVGGVSTVEVSNTSEVVATEHHR